MNVTESRFKNRQLHIEDYLQMVSAEQKEYAEVAELADAQASGACGSNIVWVQVPSSALSCGVGSQLTSYFFSLLSCSCESTEQLRYHF